MTPIDTLKEDFKDMGEEELAIARKIGEDVSLHKIKIPCPVCLEDDPSSINEPQLLSSVGDYEEVLFCPHCDLRILLTVNK